MRPSIGPTPEKRGPNNSEGGGQAKGVFDGVRGGAAVRKRLTYETARLHVLLESCTESCKRKHCSRGR